MLKEYKKSCGCAFDTGPRAEEATEPLLALYEGDEGFVLGTGACATEEAAFEGSEALRGAPIAHLQIARVQKGAAGFDFLPPQTVALGSKTSCLPWVKIARDPNRFRTCMAEARRLGQVKDSRVVAKLLKEHLATEDQEVFFVVLLDRQLMVRGISELARGARDSVQAPIPDVLRLAIVDGATAVLVVHNHPSGKVVPSKADKHLTQVLDKALKTVDLVLLDHVILGFNDHFSFVDHGLL